MPKIIPIKDLKNTQSISEMCRIAEEPIYITKNGYGDMVIMSIETYEDTMQMFSLYKSLERSERDIAEGKTEDAHEAISKLKKKYEL